MRAMQGILIGTLLGLTMWSAAGLAYIWCTAAQSNAAPQEFTCHTDAECEAEWAAKGMPIDKD